MCRGRARRRGRVARAEAVRICGARWGESSARVALPRLVLAETFFAQGDRASAKAEALAALAVAPSETPRARAERVLMRCRVFF